MKMDKLNIFWKAYFWSILTFLGGVLSFFLLNENKIFFGNIFSKVYDIFFLILLAISLLAIKGYIENKRYFSKSVWIFLFFIIIIDSFGYLAFEFNGFLVENSQYLIFLILFLPWFYALYRYTFFMNELFEEDINYEIESFSSLISG